MLVVDCELHALCSKGSLVSLDGNGTKQYFQLHLDAIKSSALGTGSYLICSGVNTLNDRGRPARVL